MAAHETNAIQDSVLAVGTVVDDRYRILGLAGKGGNGIVYKAKHVHMSRIVALKMLLPDVGNHVQEFKRFRQEAEAASQLRHPNIVTVYDFGPIGETQFYLAMDYLEGKSLYDTIKQTGPLSLQRFQKVFKQACDALEHAHKNQVVHRDIKPGNFVLIERDGEPDFLVIVDFGLVKMMSPTEDQHLTTTGTVVGSPLYMSPEQCRGLPLDHRTDIYSLGCVMYEALVGRQPLFGPTIVDTISKHLHDTPAKMKEVNPTIYVPPALERAVLKALSKDPHDRQQSMAELGKEIAAALSGAPDVSVASVGSVLKPSVESSGRASMNRPVSALQSSSGPSQQSLEYQGLTAHELAAQALTSHSLALSTPRSKTSYRMVGWLIALATGGIMTTVIVGSLVVAMGEMKHLKKGKTAVQDSTAIAASTPGTADGTSSSDVPSNTVSDGSGQTSTPSGPGDTSVTASSPKTDSADRSQQVAKLELIERDANSAFESENWSLALTGLKESVPLREQLVGGDDATVLPFIAKLVVVAWQTHDSGLPHFLQRFKELSSLHPEAIVSEYNLLSLLCDPVINSHDPSNVRQLSQLLVAAISQSDADPMVRVQLRMQLARLQCELGRTEVAERMLRKCVEESRSNAEVNEKAKSMLGDLLRQLGKSE